MQAASEGIVGHLRGMALFEGLEGTALATLARAAGYRSVGRDERVYWQGGQPTTYFHVISGRVTRALASPRGDEKVIDMIPAGQGFGLVELFGHAPYVSFAAASETSVLLEIAREGLMDAIRQSPPLALRILAAAAQRQAAFETDVAACFFHSGCRRLVDYLVRIAGPDFDPGGDTLVELPLSKRMIAASIGVSAETLSRSFRDLSEAGLIEVRGRRVTLLSKLTARHALPAGESLPGHLRVPQNRRRTDAPWVDRPGLALPPGSRAWM